MRRIEVKAEAASSADPARVYALLKDGSTWPQWTIFDSHELERPGDEEPLGVGSIRVFRTSYSASHEKVVELRPGRRLSYELTGGLPLVDYHADVDLEPLANGGTRIFWRSQFQPKHFGTGWFWKWMMNRTVRQVSQNLADGAANPTIVPQG
ncbi:MAG TPA: SRPBCC family protein [Caulobacteraceae bacterium]|jgi:hypothetical protein|nr:SRPBCC family protein [Caulobacteraceae bacterium]